MEAHPGHGHSNGHGHGHGPPVAGHGRGLGHGPPTYLYDLLDALDLGHEFHLCGPLFPAGPTPDPEKLKARAGPAHGFTLDQP